MKEKYLKIKKVTLNSISHYLVTDPSLRLLFLPNLIYITPQRQAQGLL